jgi:Ca2+-binding EF-hand superfamily protein
MYYRFFYSKSIFHLQIFSGFVIASCVESIPTMNMVNEHDEEDEDMEDEYVDDFTLLKKNPAKVRDRIGKEWLLHLLVYTKLVPENMFEAEFSQIEKDDKITYSQFLMLLAKWRHIDVDDSRIWIAMSVYDVERKHEIPESALREISIALSLDDTEIARLLESSVNGVIYFDSNDYYPHDYGEYTFYGPREPLKFHKRPANTGNIFTNEQYRWERRIHLPVVQVQENNTTVENLDQLSSDVVLHILDFALPILTITEKNEPSVGDLFCKCGEDISFYRKNIELQGTACTKYAWLFPLTTLQVVLHDIPIIYIPILLTRPLDNIIAVEDRIEKTGIVELVQKCRNLKRYTELESDQFPDAAALIEVLTTHPSVTDVGLLAFKRFEGSVHDLNITLTETQLQRLLSAKTNFRSLSFVTNSLSTSLLNTLISLQHLRSLSVHVVTLEQKTVDAVFTMSNLTNLSISTSNGQRVMITNISNLVNLQSLRLAEIMSNDDELLVLNNCKQLTYLELEDEKVSQLPQLLETTSTLQTLYIKYSSVKEDILEAVSKCQTLHKIIIEEAEIQHYEVPESNIWKILRHVWQVADNLPHIEFEVRMSTR